MKCFVSKSQSIQQTARKNTTVQIQTCSLNAGKLECTNDPLKYTGKQNIKKTTRTNK